MKGVIKMAGKKNKFNIIDALIIIVLAIAVAVLAYVFVISDHLSEKGETHTIEYVIEATSLNEIFRDSVSQGDKVFIETSSMPLEIGVVTAQPEVTQNYKTYYDNETGEEVYTPAESLINIKITFRATAEKTEWGYCIDDSAYITVNNSNVFLIGDLQCAAVCTGLTVID